MSFARGAILAVTFVAVHAVLIAENLLAPNGPLGDVQVTYPAWWSTAVDTGAFPGLSAPGVYPFVALFPVSVGAQGVFAWFVMVVALDALAVAVLALRNQTAAFAWLGFQLALGPIALGRLDAVTVASGVAAVALIDRAPRVTGALVAVATWIKVWPIALGVAALRAPRFTRVARWAVGVALVILAVGLSLGNPASLFSFLGQQQGRGIQVESVVATSWLWDAWRGGSSSVSFSPEIYTFEVSGPGAAAVANIVTIVQVVALLVVATVLLTNRRTVGHMMPASFGYALLVLVSVLIAANKVGSPQFVSWLAVPLVAFVIAEGSRISPVLVAMLGSVATLTHVIYPYAYFAFLDLRTVPLIMVTVRNALEVALVAVAFAGLWRRLRVEKSAQQFADLGILNEKGVVSER